jgi:thiamine-monophosphate kinase
MDFESTLIRKIHSVMPRSQDQLNGLFESDAEILDLNGITILYSIDDFSSEDMFLSAYPFSLGWNCAVGTLSDIYASGGSPLWYSHSMAVPRNWKDEFLTMFAEGIAKVLLETGVSFIGGDIGIAENWRYTGSVIGNSSERILKRIGAQAGDAVFVTGPVGCGNLQALLALHGDNADKLPFDSRKLRFSLRNKEAELMRTYASSCIDTSDGIYNSLNMIAELNGTSYTIFRIPLLDECVIASDFFTIPSEAFFFGECGEYELLFTVKPEHRSAFLEEASGQKLSFYEIGIIKKPSRRILQQNDREIDITDFTVRARDYKDIADYVSDLTAFLKADT